jgi:hypothetical protein
VSKGGLSCLGTSKGRAYISFGSVADLSRDEPLRASNRNCDQLTRRRRRRFVAEGLPKVWRRAETTPAGPWEAITEQIQPSGCSGFGHLEGKPNARPC